MKVNLLKQLTLIDGQPSEIELVKGKGKVPTTLRVVMEQALLGIYNEQISYEQKLQRARLAKRILTGPAIQEFKKEEITQIKILVGRQQTTALCLCFEEALGGQ
jgi:hypothetical protein